MSTEKIEDLKETDMNIIVLTEEHLQKIVTQAVTDGVALYVQNEYDRQRIRDLQLMQ
jgi:hypothetical protein